MCCNLRLRNGNGALGLVGQCKVFVIAYASSASATSLACAVAMIHCNNRHTRMRGPVSPTVRPACELTCLPVFAATTYMGVLAPQRKFSKMISRAIYT